MNQDDDGRKVSGVPDGEPRWSGEVPPPPAPPPVSPVPPLAAADTANAAGPGVVPPGAVRTEAVWASDTLAQAAMMAIREQRAARRWRVFFRCVWLLIVIAALVAFFASRQRGVAANLTEKVTAVVSLNGIIAANADASSDHIDAALRAAFNDKRTAGVILRINSPGGSPVEAGIIYRTIRDLRNEHKDIPLYAVIGDVGASGAYYVAAAADKIYVDPASIVGSIGVIMEGFGFPGLLDKLGVERRVQTAGVNKAIGDPFSPQTDDQKQRLQVLLDDVHQQFIAAVKQGRGDRLHVTPDTFSGAFWSGDQSVQMGLADGLGDTRYVAEHVIKVKRLRDFSVRDSLTERVARRIGTSLGASLGAAAVGEVIGSGTTLR